jgi:hypothetical protein
MPIQVAASYPLIVLAMKSLQACHPPPGLRWPTVQVVLGELPPTHLFWLLRKSGDEREDLWESPNVPDVFTSPW